MTKFKHQFPEIDVGDFFEGIDNAISEKRHVDYLTRAKENFVWYQTLLKQYFQ